MRCLERAYDASEVIPSCSGQLFMRNLVADMSLLHQLARNRLSLAIRGAPVAVVTAAPLRERSAKLTRDQDAGPLLTYSFTASR